jgi:hypothetical protein
MIDIEKIDDREERKEATIESGDILFIEIKKDSE